MSDDKKRELRELGAARNITRRDYLGGMAAGAGAILLSGALPGALAGGRKVDLSLPGLDADDAARFNGPGGVGDYASSNGNTWDVISRAHMLRDGEFADFNFDDVPIDEENYDVVIVGGGASSMGVMYRLAKESKKPLKTLILDNHPVFGGEAKHNAFDVDGHRIYGPQGSNLVILPKYSGQVVYGRNVLYDEFKDIGMPLEYDDIPMTGSDKPLEFDRSNFTYHWMSPISDSIVHFAAPTADNPTPKPVHNPWKNEMRGLGYSEEVRKDLMRWRWDLKLDRPREGLDEWLDQMSYEDLLVKVHGLSPEVARFCDPLLASSLGFGARTCSALLATRDMSFPGAVLAEDVAPGERPGPAPMGLTEAMTELGVGCFPGGNSYPYRYFARYIWPDIIKDGKRPGDVLGNPIRFEILDAPTQQKRMRLGATVYDVRHVKGSNGKKVRVVYGKDGRLRAVTAKTVVMCSGAWVNRHILRDAPGDVRGAMSKFMHAPMLIANVALTNWRFMERMGATIAQYEGGEFGFTCNIRQPLDLPGYQPPLDPGKPIVLTFYVPFTDHTLPPMEQGQVKRWELFSTPYRDFELKIRRQLVQLFGQSGFDPARDIAGITINRWGHAYTVPQPGFVHPHDGSTAPSDVLRAGYGNIHFAHSELFGVQEFVGALTEGQRAARQVLEKV